MQDTQTVVHLSTSFQKMVSDDFKKLLYNYFPHNCCIFPSIMITFGLHMMKKELCPHGFGGITPYMTKRRYSKYNIRYWLRTFLELDLIHLYASKLNISSISMNSITCTLYMNWTKVLSDTLVVFVGYIWKTDKRLISILILKCIIT